MPAPFVLLLVEHEDIDQTQSLAPKLQGDTHDLLVAHSLEETVEVSQTQWPSLIIVHLENLPIDLLDLRKSLLDLKLEIPSIFYGNKANAPEKINPDTTFVNNDSLPELARAITQTIGKQKDRYLRTDRLVLDCTQGKVLNSYGASHSLTPKELRLLHLLMERDGRILSRKEIMEQVWNTDYLGDTRTLDVHIRWLRQKIEAKPSKPLYLKTVRGEGYMLLTNINQV